jgi:hypothetical protein
MSRKNKSEFLPTDVGRIMDANLKKMAVARKRASDSIPARAHPLKTLLMMPMHTILQNKVAKSYYRRLKRLVWTHWQDVDFAMKQTELKNKIDQFNAARCVQSAARKKQALHRVNILKEKRDTENRELWRHATTIVQCLARRKAASAKVANKRFLKWQNDNHSSAVLIQKHFRRYLVRGDVINRARRALLSFLRDWGHGSMASLTSRSNLQSIDRGPVVAMAIKLTQAKDRPVRHLPKLSSVYA